MLFRSELRTGGDISGMRRNLQREHLKRISAALLKASGNTPADARSLQRENALTLASHIRSAVSKPMSKEAKAHLSESLNTLNEALKAPVLEFVVLFCIIVWSKLNWQ